MGYLWDRYGFVRRSHYLWQKERANTLSLKFGQGVWGIGAGAEAIDLQQVVNELRKQQLQKKGSELAAMGRKPSKTSKSAKSGRNKNT